MDSAQEAKVREEVFDHQPVPAEQARARHEDHLLGGGASRQVGPACPLRHRQIHFRVLQPCQLHCDENDIDRVKCRRQARGHRSDVLCKYFYKLLLRKIVLVFNRFKMSFGAAVYMP